MQPIVSIDGSIIDTAHGGLSARDRGFLLGDGVFETMRGMDGTIWFLDRHLDRLTDAAHRMRIPLPAMVPEWINHAVAQGFANGMHAATIRVTVSRGVALTPGLATSGAERPTVVVAVTARPEPTVEADLRGIAISVSRAPRNERAITAGIKTTSYAESVAAFHEAHATGYDDALFLDTRGYVSETSVSNVFAVMGDTLVTSPESCGILPGITRAVILECAEPGGNSGART